MDLFNERNHIKKKSLDDTINEMKQQLQEAKMKIYDLEQQVEKKNIDLFESSVRVDENIRDLYIIEVEDQYKLCADSSNRPPNVIKHFIFPASMNIKKAIAKKFNIKYPYNFDKPRLNEIIKEIENLIPKGEDESDW